MGCCRTANGKPLAINGVWALSPGNVSPANSDAAAAPAAQVYFTAGPNHGFRRPSRLFDRGASRVDRRECSVIVTANSQCCRGGIRHPKASTVPIASALGTAEARARSGDLHAAPQQVQIFRSIEGPVSEDIIEKEEVMNSF